MAHCPVSRVILPSEDEFIITNQSIKAKPYTTTKSVDCKMRWRGRKLKDIMSVEFALDEEYINQACEEGRIKVKAAGKSSVPHRAKPDTVLRNGDGLVHTWRVEEPKVKFNEGDERIILIEDMRGILAVHKPAGLPTHSGGKYMRTCLVHILTQSLNVPIIRPINRLDRDTSGVILLAKNAAIHERLKDKSLLAKVYVADVGESATEVPSVCRAPIVVEKHVPNQPLMSKVVDEPATDSPPAPQQCTTLFRHLGNGIVACRPITGKTHQIRVHLSHMGFPIKGDTLYGGSPTPEGRLRLHAYCYRVKDPAQDTDNAFTDFVSPVNPEWCTRIEGWQTKVDELLATTEQPD